MFSFGFQQAYRRGLKSEDHIFFTKVRPTLISRGAPLMFVPVLDGCEVGSSRYDRRPCAERIHALRT